MQYFFVGIVLGIALNLLGLWQPTGAIEIYSEWHGKIDSIDNIENSDKPSISRIKLFPIKTERGVFILSGNGALLDSINIDNHLISISRNATDRKSVV